MEKERKAKRQFKIDKEFIDFERNEEDIWHPLTDEQGNRIPRRKIKW